MSQLIGTTQNGNYTITMFSDGTKVRFCKEDTYVPTKPESMDLKITNKCDRNCMWCHEASSSSGEHGDIMNLPFIKTLNPYTEIAIGGGNPLEHPDLEQFLIMCKEHNLICNMTVNQYHFERYFDSIKELVDNELIYGLGISLMEPTPEFIELVKEIPNAVIHVIAGIVSRPQLRRMYDQNLKLLILGYKHFRKGKTFYKSSVDRGALIDTRINKISSMLPEIIEKFKVVSFDNLAIKQLDVKSIVPEEDLDHFYMGDDGNFTMYVDAVKREYAVSSTSDKRYPFTSECIETMFSKVRAEVGK